MAVNAFNIEKLKSREAQFLQRYPGGFSHPEMQAIGKKHKMPQMIEFVKSSFAPAQMENIHVTADNMIKTVSRSSMVSIFEKPKFRDFVNRLNEMDKAFLVDALNDILHGPQKQGFENMLSLLATEKLAKWTLLTVIPVYYRPNKEVFVKPNTVKGILKTLEVENLVYKPTPTWNFYRRYRELIKVMKQQVTPDLSPNNAAFSGFLMATNAPKI